MESLLGGYNCASSSEAEDADESERIETHQTAEQYEKTPTANIKLSSDDDGLPASHSNALKIASNTYQSATSSIPQPPADCSQEHPDPSLTRQNPNRTTKPSTAKFPRPNKRHMERPNRPNPEHGDLPSELARELARTGHSVLDVSFVDVDATASLVAPSAHVANGPNKSTVNAKAGRISKKAGVSRIERRKHQITALAADAAALQAAQRSLGVSVQKGKRSGKGR